MTSKGAIQVHVYTSIAQIPIKDAAVTVTDTNGDAIGMGLTNRSGQLDRPITVIVPELSLSQSPGASSRPYALAELYVRKENFEEIYIKNLQIFPDTETVQQLELIPLPEYPESFNRSETFITTPQNL